MTSNENAMPLPKNRRPRTERSNAGEADQGDRILARILDQCGFTVAARERVAGRDGVYLPIPRRLHSHVQELLQATFPSGIYSHQAIAIEHVLAGRDVCVATSTATGKSLIFMASAAHALMEDPAARVLVLYPAKALLHDQLLKWGSVLDPLRLSSGFIDGSVPVGQRREVLSSKRVVMMTPDVAHAWLMTNLTDPAIAAFRANLRLIILDEAHTYDGVFGTNMAFFLRRLQAVARAHRLICSTATLGQPGAFIKELTGRDTVEVGRAEEGAKVASKDVVLVRRNAGENLDATGSLLRMLAQQHPGRFLAFADSRRAVELFATASHRRLGDAEEVAADPTDAVPAGSNIGILPYRAGYESCDRKAIQDALTSGDLRGVVATGALEMGLDIGEIDLVLLLDTPNSMKSFWQRAGRAGRKNRGICMILDNRNAICDGEHALRDFLSRPIERNWLYLGNRYAQYTNALCAAAEIGQINGSFDRSQFASLPGQFLQMLDNELNPTTSIAPDLYPLRQIAQGDPHHEFPLRSGIEKSFRIATRQGECKGDISFEQALREAYPGAVYHYMAKPYRVQRVNIRNGEITVHPERRYATKPIRFAMVFPDLGPDAFQLLKAKDGFMAETEMQVSERVTGFKEIRGTVETTHNYGPASQFSQQPLTRIIRTTGVCWSFPRSGLVSDTVAVSVLQAFCEECSVQPRDLGIGRFHSQTGPCGATPVSGVCIFDNSNGSLRLTERLGRQFEAIVKIAHTREVAKGNHDLADDLEELRRLVAGARKVAPTESSQGSVVDSGAELEGDGWISVISPGSKAILNSTSGAQEVVVVRHFYTPGGIQYQLESPTPTVRWTVTRPALEFIHGVTLTQMYNLMTGEIKP